MIEAEPNPRPSSPQEMASLKHWGGRPESLQTDGVGSKISVECGWGRLVFGQTFSDADDLAAAVQQEREGQRDVALYVRDPHVVLSKAPHALFLDPSHTFRLDLDSLPEIPAEEADRITIRRAAPEDQAAIDTIYEARRMVPLAEGFIASLNEQPATIVLVAEDKSDKQIHGVVMGVDHTKAFGDPDNGSSLWALAVDTRTRIPGVGRKLVIALATHFRDQGRSFMDLSVIHNNKEAIALYDKLGFKQVPAYCIKKKNPVNERLFIGPKLEETLNPYAQIIVDEARRRGIAVKVEDASTGLFCLSLGGRSVSCRESLSELTSAVALSRCDDKTLTHRLLAKANLKVPGQALIKKDSEALTFLKKHDRIVVKPASGEQGRGVYVDLSTPTEVIAAVKQARTLSDQVLVEEYISGHDLRIIVIGGEVVAGAIRKPATIVGDGVHTIIELIAKQSRRRAAATRNESTIPFDEETERTVLSAGYQMLDLLPRDVELQVRKTANLHTGGTMQDVTAELHEELKRASIEAANVLNMPVVGLDLIVESPASPDYRFIEANERPGLANHEPAPTAQKFIDLLFPETRLKAKKSRKEKTTTANAKS